MASQTKISDLEPNAFDDPSSGKERKSSRPKRTTASARAESELRGRLTGCFERIAESLDARGDDELAELIREDAEVIGQGLVSLTRPFTALRGIVLAVVAIIEPVMAFGRIGRVLFERMSERRARRIQEQEMAQREQQ